MIEDEGAELTGDTEPGDESGKPKPKAKRPSGAQRRKAANRQASVQGEVNALLLVVGAGWTAVDDVCGGAFMAQVPAISKAIGDWAQVDPRLYDIIVATTSSSGPLSVAIAVMPILQTVAIHHLGPAIARRRAAAAAAGEWAGDPDDNDGRVGQVAEYVDRAAV